MIFKYKAYDKSGKKISSKIEADSIKEAKNKLTDYIIIEIKPIKKLNLNISFSSKISKLKLSRTLHTLGLYLNSGISIINSLKLTKNQQEDIKLEKFLEYLYQEINKGKSFYNALNSQKILKLPNYIISSIKIGEESSKLDVVLIEMSEYLKIESKIESKSKQALIYPLFIFIVSIFMVVFMLTTIVPKIMKVFNTMHQHLPPITQFVINSSNFLKHNYLSISFIIIMIIISFIFSYKKIYKVRYLIDSFLLKLPIISNMIQAKELSRFTYLLFILTNSGINFVQSLNLATNTLENEKIKLIFDKALQEVIKGKKFSISLSKVGFWDKTFLQSIALAEETSNISSIMKNLSEIYFEENEVRINTLLSLLEPVMIILIGGIVGFIVTALLLPMFSINLMN